MVIWSILSLFGLVIVFRTIKNYQSLRLFSESILQKIQIVSAILILVVNFVLHEHIISIWLIQVVIFLSPLLLSKIIQVRRENTICEDQIIVLDSIIIFMRSGAALRVAIEKSSGHVKTATTLALKEFLTSLQYKNNRENLSKLPAIKNFFDELADIDSVGHKQVDRLRAMKRRMLTEKSFRQKSRQATVQIRAQAWIMAVMYVGLLGFICNEFGFWKNSSIILISSVIFLMGLFMVINIGRTYQWKL